MNNAEPRSILSNELRAFAARPSDELVRSISRAEVKNMSSESGVSYQIEISVFWDSEPDKDLRIMGSIDDGGWRAFLPLTESLIMRPDGTLIYPAD
jgi:hypothetical protein